MHGQGGVMYGDGSNVTFDGDSVINFFNNNALFDGGALSITSLFCFSW